jgi:putative flippase GtrA
MDLLKKFVKFGIVGASGVVVDFGITGLLRDGLLIHQYVANSIGFLCAVVSNYMLNRRWTFRSKDPAVAAQFTKFLSVAIVGLALNNGFIYLLHDKGGLPFYGAKLLATGVVMIWNFVANTKFTFKH